MRVRIGRTAVVLGFAQVVATAIRAVADLLQAELFDPWSLVLASGCVLMSVGWGLTRERQ